MNQISPSKTGFGAKTLILGGSVLLTACASVFALRKLLLKKKQKNLQELTEEEVYSILRDFRKEFYPLLKEISVSSKNIQSQYMAQLGYQHERIKDILFMEIVQKNPFFEKSVENVEMKVLVKNKVNDPDVFKDSCKALAKKSKQIETIMREIKLNFEKAVLGVILPPSITLPDTVTCEMVLHQYKEKAKSIVMTLAVATQKFVEKYGPRAFNSPDYEAFVKKMTFDEEKDQKPLIDYPQELIRDYHPQQLFMLAFSKYLLEDPEFKKAVLKIETRNQEIIKQIYAENCDFEKIIKDIQEFKLPSDEEEKKGFYIDVKPNNAIEEKKDVVENAPVEEVVHEKKHSISIKEEHENEKEVQIKNDDDVVIEREISDKEIIEDLEGKDAENYETHPELEEKVEEKVEKKEVAVLKEDLVKVEEDSFKEIDHQDIKRENIEIQDVHVNEIGHNSQDEHQNQDLNTQ